MIEITLIAKAVGALVGSSVAVVRRSDNDSIKAVFQRLFSGAVIGFILAPIVMNKMEWESDPSLWFSAAAIGGVVGYAVLEIVLSEDIKTRLKQAISHILPGGEK